MFYRALSFALTVTLAVPAVAQQSPVPDRRVIYENNVDFYGNDLSSIYETTQELCERACIDDVRCNAFTFNTRALACFLKSDIQSRESYEGALSARIVLTDAASVSRGADLVGNLDFLSQGVLSTASGYGRQLARDYYDNGQTGEALLNQARQVGSNNRVVAMFLSARAVVALDDAVAWSELARQSLALKDTKSDERNRARNYALYASINAYLRSENDAQQAENLSQMAKALEWQNDGRSALSAMRLATTLSPRQDLQLALDRLIGLYGFRVVDTRVDSDSQNPRVCLTFNEKLVQAGVEYAPYVAIDGADLPVEASGRDLCIEGLEHGQRVNFTLREGLPAASGEALSKDVRQSHYIRDRSPQVRFMSRAYVLPRTENASIPLVTVNADEVKLSIHRVTERNIVPAIRQNLVGKSLYPYEMGHVNSTWGEAVWEGYGSVKNTLNSDVTTAMPIGDAVETFKPGVYVLSAVIEGEEQEGPPATQWFIVSDIGISTLLGNDGLHVSVRGLTDALPREGFKVELISRNNQVLASATTDANGAVQFDAAITRGQGGNAPGLVTVRDADADFAFLDLSEAGFDLSDRGVDGRSAPQPVDVFVSTERGAYRPGESVFATILARDPDVTAIPDLPLTVVIRRPDGVEFRRDVLADAGAGGRAFTMDLPAGAARGTWRMQIYADTEAPALANTTFLVEDFVPERIDFEISMADGPVRLDSTSFINIDARYLYGAPGADLSVEGDIRFIPVRSLDGYDDYRFGRHDASNEILYGWLDGDGVTDEQGKVAMTIGYPDFGEIQRPYKMEAIVRLADSSGRPVERILTKPVAAPETMIGVKPLFDGAAEEGGLAEFQMVAVAPSGDQVDIDGVAWELSRIRRDWQWYSLNGRWQWEAIISREKVANGTVDLKAGEAVDLAVPVDWGEYELVLSGPTSTGQTLSSMSFYAGWYSSGNSDTPDQLQVSLDAETYAPGDTATLRVEARDPGQMVVQVLSDGVIDTQMLAVEAGATEVTLNVTEDWSPGVYVMATLIRPMDQAAGRNPSRAIGLGWVPVDPGPAELKVAFVSADTAKPRNPLIAELEVTGAQPGQEVYATIAAVDVGVLNITGFDAPTPVDYYLGQRELGVEIRDLYGRLIDGMQGDSGSLRQGGDGSSSGSTSPPPTEDLVAYFQGPLKADENGRITASFDIPDFNGTVKLMAVVWSQEGVGQAEQDVIIRDPVVVSASLPRFLAPGDKSRLLLDIDNIDGPPGEYQLSVQGVGGLPVSDRQFLSLGKDQKTSVSVPVSALLESLDSALEVTLTTPDGEALTKRLRLAVIANDPEISRQSRFELAAGDTLSLNDDIFTGLRPGAEAVLSAGPLARFDAPGLLNALSTYAYGCTEQSTSKTLALIYFNQVAARLGGHQRANIEQRIAEGIQNVLANQDREGGFGLWRASSDGDLWLNAYVTDFLTRAREEGHEVPELAYQQALDNLQNQLNYQPDFEEGGQAIAYALYTLARVGRASMGDLRYYADEKADDFATPLAKAQIGAALAAYGDPGRADAMIRKAVAQIEQRRTERRVWRADYGSYLRDDAAVLFLAVEAGSNAVSREAFVDRLITARTKRRYFSTQEQLWQLMAARALINDNDHDGLLFNGKAPDGPLVETLTDQQMKTSFAVLENTSTRDTDVVLSVFGVPETPEPAGGNGYTIIREYFDLSGQRVDLSQVTQNDRLLVVLSVTPQRELQARLMVTDPLPAGFEIENPSLIRSGDLSAFGWLKQNAYPKYTEFATDRFSAAVDWRKTDSFQLAYQVRVISPGEFHHPAASVEDMYRPAYRARTETGKVTVLAEDANP
ncbi:alpha-2-macroglobulin family protein [Halovulum sp. GXIMD14793]